MAKSGPPVISERVEAVGIAHLARLETHNALDEELMGALAVEIEAFDADPAVRCVVIAGANEVFATGGDALGEGADPELWRRVAGCGTPLVAAVSGYALGGGFELALLCDLVVASESSELGQPEVTVGLIPGGGATQRLTAVIGKQRAMELVLTGRRIDALEAQRLGLVNQVTGKRQWLDRAIELARVVASRPPVATRLAKTAVLTADELALEAGLARERELYEQARAEREAGT
ncbi:MAG: enoyl-CoA hydratase-related protein [Actinomycetota bacterium]|nr:enoyl-CoA hydratase-related protein [Actinomycetota bacterium]